MREDHMIRAHTGLILSAVLVGGAVTAAARDVAIPKGTYLELTSTSAFDSDHAKRGDTFTAVVTRGLWVENELAIPAGSTVFGEIKAVRSPGDGSVSAAVGVKFESLDVGGARHDIEGVLVSLKADDRRAILEQQAKLVTGRHVDVILIGSGTEADGKADTLVGISGADRDDLADGWAKSGLGPALVHIAPGTLLTMEFDSAVTLPASLGERTEADRNIYVAPGTIKSLQRALRVRNYYTGDASGTLDQPTRDAIARFQLDQGQLGTGDADEPTVQALGVATAGLR
jgi:putative peptidoglycan binding protein